MHSVSMSMSASMAASITVYTYYTHCLYLMKKSLDLIQSYPIWYAWLTTQIQVIGWLCITSYDCVSNTNPGFHAKRGTHATWYAWLTAMWHASWHMTLIYAWLIHTWSDSFIFVIHSCVTWLMTLRHCMGVIVDCLLSPLDIRDSLTCHMMVMTPRRCMCVCNRLSIERPRHAWLIYMSHDGHDMSLSSRLISNLSINSLTCLWVIHTWRRHSHVTI